MRNRIVTIFIGTLIGVFILAAVIWLLRSTLGDHETLYAGKSLDAWRQQLDSPDAGARNQANEALNTEIVPRLVDQMFHDTNDSNVRLSLVELVNGIPGVHVYFTRAVIRRFDAARDLGIFGPPAKSAVPSLIQALQGPQAELHEIAIKSLGRIHSNPDAVIPLLISFLTNEDLNEAAATALGDYGSLARQAFPELVPLLHAGDPHTRGAARAALKQIDSDAASKLQTALHRENGP